MSQFFAGNYTGPAFQLFGVAHIAALVFLVALNLYLIRFKLPPKTQSGPSAGHLRSFCGLLKQPGTFGTSSVGTWTIQTLLPLNICSALIWLSWLYAHFQKLPDL